MTAPAGVTAHQRARRVAQSSPTNCCISSLLSDADVAEAFDRFWRRPCFMTFLVANAALHRRVDAEHVAHGLAQRLIAVEHDEHALLDIQPALDEVRQHVVATVAFSVEPSRSPSGCLTPSVSMPSATQQRPLSSIPSSISACAVDKRRR